MIFYYIVLLLSSLTGSIDPHALALFAENAAFVDCFWMCAFVVAAACWCARVCAKTSQHPHSA